MSTMRVALATVGTTGDVVPFAALAAALRAGGHQVTTVSWELHRPTLEPVADRFVAAGPGTTWEDVADTARRAAAARSPLDQVAVLRDFHLRDAPSHHAQLVSALAGHDLVVLHGIHALAEAAAADVGAPWATAVFDPVLLPTRTAPPPGMPGLGPLNRVTWWMLDRLLRRGDPPLHEALAAAGSKHGSAVTMFRSRSRRLHLVACSPTIAPPPADLAPHVRFTGAWISPGPPGPLDPDLEAFLSAGDPPVVVTFGSMVPDDAVRLSDAVHEAIAASGVRAVVQLGVAGPVRSDDPVRVRSIGVADHRALLPRALAVVHHGGAGTSHAAVAAGIPSVVVPHVGDQRYWAERLFRLGVGARPLPLASVTAAALAERLTGVLTDAALRARARTCGEAVRAEDGVGLGVQLLEAAVAD